MRWGGVRWGRCPWQSKCTSSQVHQMEHSKGKLRLPLRHPRPIGVQTICFVSFLFSCPPDQSTYSQARPAQAQDSWHQECSGKYKRDWTELPLQEVTLDSNPRWGLHKASRLLGDRSFVTKVDEGLKEPNVHRDGAARHTSPAPLALASTQAFLTTRGCAPAGKTPAGTTRPPTANHLPGSHHLLTGSHLPCCLYPSCIDDSLLPPRP